nr:4940_t:CDS:2 [Entrophospora candida]
MSNTEHSILVALLVICFNVRNGDVPVLNCPILVAIGICKRTTVDAQYSEVLASTNLEIICGLAIAPQSAKSYHKIPGILIKFWENPRDSQERRLRPMTDRIWTQGAGYQEVARLFIIDDASRTKVVAMAVREACEIAYLKKTQQDWEAACQAILQNELLTRTEKSTIISLLKSKTSS